MAKPEWGSKRVCLSCGAKFYDLGRDPIVCPSCEAVFDPAANSKPRRSRAAPTKAAAAAAPAVAEAETEVEADVEETADDDTEDDTEDEGTASAGETREESDEDSESAIEDVSELGDDDMTDVIDTEIDEDDSER